jgi:hypothetical protein
MPLAYAFSNCTLPRPFLFYIITFHLKRMMNSHTQLTLIIRHEATVCLMWKCRTSHTHVDLCQVITTYAIINKWVYTRYISTHFTYYHNEIPQHIEKEHSMSFPSLNMGIGGWWWEHIYLLIFWDDPIIPMGPARGCAVAHLEFGWKFRSAWL